MVDQALLKPPRFGSAKPYHQDNYYFRCQPDDEVITAWIALDDVDEQNGCLRYIDGSHRGPILPHDQVPGEDHNYVPPTDLIDLSNESLAVARKGAVVFHHSRALHTSHRNESDRWRRGWATHWVTANVTSDTETLTRAYFRRPELQAILRPSMS
jgi:ectoine hydroxylase-related dioxygenase (phytanoyl-CoA dioxygenase family)